MFRLNIVATLMQFAKHPVGKVIIIVAFVANLFIPDPIPLIDELFLAWLTYEGWLK